MSTTGTPAGRDATQPQPPPRPHRTTPHAPRCPTGPTNGGMLWSHARMRDPSRLGEDQRRPPNLRAPPRAHPTTLSTGPTNLTPPAPTPFSSQDQTHTDAGRACFLTSA